jgi:N-methylhydantoinase B
VAGGFVSRESAREDYGVVLDAAGLVDLTATQVLRGLKRGPVRMFHRNGYFGPLVDHTPEAPPG